MIEAAGQLARQQGCTRLWVITTNDNVDALRFYQRRGFCLVGVHRGAVDRSRASLKPEIPAAGAYRIPLRDEIELERHPWALIPCKARAQCPHHAGAVQPRRGPGHFADRGQPYYRAARARPPGQQARAAWKSPGSAADRAGASASPGAALALGGRAGAGSPRRPCLADCRGEQR